MGARGGCGCRVLHAAHTAPLARCCYIRQAPAERWAAQLAGPCPPAPCPPIPNLPSPPLPRTLPLLATRMSPGRQPLASTMFSQAAMMKCTCGQARGRGGGAALSVRIAALRWAGDPLGVAPRLARPRHATRNSTLPGPPPAAPTLTPSGLIWASALAAPSVAPEPPMSNCGRWGGASGGAGFLSRGSAIAAGTYGRRPAVPVGREKAKARTQQQAAAVQTCCPILSACRL